ncbi:clumping factor A-like isoform X3 [Dreissena polymorpha]|uniref:clumping factor A-like isoform X3 n=1 Tax=Dreissena polymorpha TaxID=45954 RepID=UPI00226505BC|nr:clumping factor A-like isoform X3 [Dreissena polymorpha]
MFSRIILQNLWRSGKHVTQKILKTETKKAVQCQTVVRPKRRIGWISQSFQEFIDSAKRQAFKQAFWRGRHDKNILLFAFAGFVVARQSEGDKRLSEIQDIINVKDQSDDLELPSLTFLGRELPLDIFEIGRNIRQGCDNAVYETRCNSAVDEVAETEETDQTDSDQCEFENEESKTESEITTQFLTSQDASASFVFKVHEYYDESLIRGGSDEVCDVSIFDRTDDEIEPWSAVDQIKDHKDLDERELENDESDTESDITVLSYTSQDANAPEYDDERHIRGGSDEVCDVSIPYWTENEIKRWSAIDIHHTEDSAVGEFENEDSDTDSDITVLSTTYQFDRDPAVFNVPEYDEEWKIRRDSDEVCDVSILDLTEDETEPWSAIDIDHVEESGEVDLENEDSDTESFIMVTPSTNQDASAPAVFNVIVYDDESPIRETSDERRRVVVHDLTEEETGSCSATEISQEGDLKDSDVLEFKNEDSDTESSIIVMSSTDQDTSAPAVSKVHVYDEGHIREGSDDNNDSSILDTADNGIELWSTVGIDHMEALKRARKSVKEDLYRLQKKRLCLEIVLLNP